MPSDPSNAEDLLEVPGDVAKFYYNGLPSRPKLVRRSNREPFFIPYGMEAYFPSKELKPIYYDHKIASVWEPLSDEVIRRLSTLKVDWTTIDVVRIGEVGQPASPVILWIGVTPNSLSGADSCTVVFDCLALLQKYLLPDVEVEIRESIYSRLSSPLLPSGDFRDLTADICRPLTSTLGLKIASEQSPEKEGTGGLYLSNGTDGKRYLLTAKHVVFSEGDLQTDYTYVEGSVRRKVILMGTGAYKQMLKSIDDITEQLKIPIERYKLALEDWKTKLPGLEESSKHRLRVQQRHDEDKSELDRLENTKHTLHELRTQVTTNWESVDQRVIGHVVRSPPLALNVGTSGYTEDVAIIELDNSRFDESTFQGNVIDFGLKSSDKSFRAKMFPTQVNKSEVDVDPSSESRSLLQGRFLAFHGMIDEAEMRNPTTVDVDGKPCLFVTMQGGISDVMYGRANGISSRIRNITGGSEEPSTEWCILPYDAKLNRFSQAGDSGSVIVDGHGRIGGLLTGGTYRTLSADPDISYVTPFAWLFPRIQAMGFPNMQPETGRSQKQDDLST